MFLYINIVSYTLAKLISSRSVFVDSLGFSLSPTNRDSFVSSFLICMPLISFSRLIALAGTSGQKSNKSDETGHP